MVTLSQLGELSRSRSSLLVSLGDAQMIGEESKTNFEDLNSIVSYLANDEAGEAYFEELFACFSKNKAVEDEMKAKAGGAGD